MYKQKKLCRSRLIYLGQSPKPDWHPNAFIQYNKLDPQVPERLQQLPNAEPLHVDLLFAPHLRSVLTFSLAADDVAAGAEEVRVLLLVPARVLVEVEVVTGRVDVLRLVGRVVELVAAVEGAAEESTGAALDAAGVEDEPEPGHLPNRGLHPVPQWSALVPHHPYCEQHSPSANPAQVKPLAAPQDPSLETTRLLGAEVGADADEDVRVPVDAAADPEEGAPKRWMYGVRLSSHIQFPRHSTNLKKQRQSCRTCQTQPGSQFHSGRPCYRSIRIGSSTRLGRNLCCRCQSRHSCHHHLRFLPRQVKPDVPPQVLSVETAVGVAADPLDVALPVPDDVAVDPGAEKEDEDATRPVAALRYQFASGSPRHSPRVTSL